MGSCIAYVGCCLLLLLHLHLLQVLMPMGSKLAENFNKHNLDCRSVPWPWAASSKMCVSHDTYVSLDGVDVSCPRASCTALSSLLQLLQRIA